MNLHINYNKALKTLVTEVIYNSKPLDKVLAAFFKSQNNIHFQDKESVFHVLTFIIRHWILIHEIYQKLFSNPHIDFQEILHIQNILDRHFHGKLVCKNAYERQVLDIYQNLSHVRNVRESYPEWLDNLCLEHIDEKWDEVSHNLNQMPHVVLRVNTLKTTLLELQQKMNASGKSVSSINPYPFALQVNKYFDIFKSSEFQAGLFEVQDAGSQAIAPFLDVAEGMRVIDACAGNGGKTLHLSGLMKNKGKIIALDIASHKLEVLQKRMKRAGAFNIETREIDSLKTIKRLYNTADRLLLDVPCSGMGVLKRNPDIKYHLSPEKLAQLQNTQLEILDKYSLMLSKDGIMVYSTCSILPSENQFQVEKFLKSKQGDFELLEDKSISPLDGFDGFYMAKIKRIK